MAIANRTQQLIDDATQELVFVIGHQSVVGEQLITHIRSAHQRGASVSIGTVDEDIRGTVHAELPDAAVFVSGLEWLRGSPIAGEETEISRLLLIDRSTSLVSSFHETETGDRIHEQAVFGRGFNTGLVAIVRRLMATGFLNHEEVPFPE